MLLKWTKPTKPLNNEFTYILNIKPEEETEDTKSFRIINKKIPFEEEEFEFSNTEMRPTTKYNCSLQVYNYTNKKILGVVETDYSYKPGIENYHKHLLDENGNFDTTEMTNINNEELVKTYFQLSAYNKMKAQDNLMATKEHIDASASCIKNNTQQINNNAGKDKYDTAFEELLKKDQEEEDTMFRTKQEEQQEDLDRINNKIARLEEIQGKVNNNQDTKIKSLKAMSDGTNLSLVNLNNNKRLLKLNQGCLTKFSKNDYAYIPCNLLNKDQYFNLDKINNLDEYNNLLLMNNNIPLDESDNKSVEYPFYILQPENSHKCVNVENKKLSIKPCTNDNTIRFTGNIVNQKCST